MSTHYDDIAEQYKRAKLIPWRHYVEQYSLLTLLGDVKGKSVLDLACGEGHYTRIVKALGAERAVGVDISTKMIELAQQSERENGLGVEYVAADARSVQFPYAFDVVLAAYLLNYARNRQELLDMCRAIARNLKPGGRFVTVNNNPLQRPENFQATRKYGFVKSADEEIRNGTALRYTIFLENETFQFDNYHLDIATHEWALREAGLDGIEWHPLELSPAEASEPNKEYWDDFFVDPSVILLECRKPLA
jgi:ubiquinone/menaquinone biosynthesis C-methylase UbiE